MIGFAISYDPEAAIAYAKQWYSSFNPAYNNYGYRHTDDTNFVSQCLIAGGQDFTGCETDDKGSVTHVLNLMSCLTLKGWKSSDTFPPGFKAGYPIIFGNHPCIATSVMLKSVLISCHNDACFNISMESVKKPPTYYYL